MATASSPTCWKTKNFLLVAAIDFGTTYSGWSFSFVDDYKRDPQKIQVQAWNNMRMQTTKAPTCILIEPDGESFHSFGYEAERKYSDLMSEGNHGEWYFFQHFKMMLNAEIIQRNTQLREKGGKELAAMKVFELCIRFLKEDMFQICVSRFPAIRETDIRWVITVPAIWNDAAKQFMREAAVLGGIANDDLHIALEPECASICCRHIKSSSDESVYQFPVGTKYVVVDAGGGTVDIIKHQVEDNNRLKECNKPSGGGFGGSLVNEAFMKFMERYFGASKMLHVQNNEVEDYIDLSNSFELTKRNFKGNTMPIVTVRIPSYLARAGLRKKDARVKHGDIKLERDRLRIASSIFASFFTESIQKTIDHMKELFQDADAADNKYILLVGGFAESQLLQTELRSAFPEKEVVIPTDAGLAVLKGAVMYGHMTSVISKRVCRYTYGISVVHKYNRSCTHPVGLRKVNEKGDLMCQNIFYIYVRSGETVVAGEEQHVEEYTCPTYSDRRKALRIVIYRSVVKDPQLVTEKGSEEVGRFTVPIESPGKDKQFEISMMFGGTEIEVKCVEISTGEITRVNVNFLG